MPSWVRSDENLVPSFIRHQFTLNMTGHFISNDVPSGPIYIHQKYMNQKTQLLLKSENLLRANHLRKNLNKRSLKYVFNSEHAELLCEVI